MVRPRHGCAGRILDAARAVDSIDLRSAQGKAYEVVDEATGRVIGNVDASASDRTLHPEAVYVHQGETWLPMLRRLRAGPVG